VGMDRATMARLFGPFFSTKPKPFTEAALLTRVRQALDEGRRRSAGGSAELAGDEGDGELQFRPVTG
jgi:hypothetical protein